MTSCLEWIRGQVGRRKILMVFAIACVRDDADRVLWQRSAEFGWWGFHGGVLELNQPLALRFFTANALPPITECHARRVRAGLAGLEEALI